MARNTETSEQRRHALRSALGMAAGMALGSGWAMAQDNYPSKPIRLVLGFPPGGSTDIVARIVADQLGTVLGTPVIVDNRPGANATIGTDYVARAAPDGYTLTLAGLSPLVMAQLTSKIPYDSQRDFYGITSVAFTPEFLAVHPSVPAKNLQELVALSKQRAVTIASSGNGGWPHLTIEQIKSQTKGNIIHVPYKGASPAVSDTIGGHVDAVVMDLPAVQEFARDGQLRGVTVFHTSRNARLPDVPTSSEQGYPALQALNWHGVLAPAKTAPAIVKKLHAALLEAVGSDKTRKHLADAGFEPFVQPSPEAFSKYLASEFDRWGKVIKESGIKFD